MVVCAETEMNLTVKVLNGTEWSLKINETDTVYKLKELVSTQLKIAITKQKLVYQGKSLSDEKTIGFYKIPENGKVVLVVKKSEDIPGPCNSTASNKADHSSTSVFWDILYRFLCRHFTERDAELVLTEFKKDLSNHVANLSLDDIERLATAKLLQAKQQGESSNS